MSSIYDDGNSLSRADIIPLAFMRGLLENAGADIDPLRIIRRIRDGLEVPGLKDALIKILQASNLQLSLLQGCQKILSGDTSSFASQLQRSQTNGAFATGTSLSCGLPRAVVHRRLTCIRFQAIPAV